VVTKSKTGEDNMQKVSRKQWKEGVAAYQSYRKKVYGKTVSVSEAEKFLSKVATVDETVKESKRRETIREATKPEDRKPDFGAAWLEVGRSQDCQQGVGKHQPSDHDQRGLVQLIREEQPQWPIAS
jgi:hypothetical protein